MTLDLRAEWGKLCSLRSPWICLLAAVVLVPGTAFTLANNVTYDAAQGRTAASATVPPLEILGSAVQFGLAMFIAFAMLAVTSEYATGAIQSTLMAEPRRWRVLMAKTAVVTAVTTLVGAGVGVLGYEVATAALGDHAAAGVPVWVAAVRCGFLVGTAAVLVSGLAAVVRSSVGTLAVSFAVLVGLLAVPEPLGPWLPARAGVEWLTSGGAAPALVLVGWSVAAWLAGWCLLERRDA